MLGQHAQVCEQLTAAINALPDETPVALSYRELPYNTCSYDILLKRHGDCLLRFCQGYMRKALKYLKPNLKK